METFPLTPDFPYNPSPRFKTLVSEYDNGDEQRRSKWETPKREFALSFRNRGQSEYDLLDAFFIARKGSLESFYFEDVISELTITVRFKEDVLQSSMSQGQIFNMECTLVEVK